MDLVKYTGGKAGPADSSLAPITVGWVNSQGGPGGTPEATVAAQAAVKYINTELGGIQGHPLKLATCYISSTEEEVQQCGQKMVNNSAVKLVNVSFMGIVSGGPLYTLTGPRKPLLGVSASTPAEFGAKNAFFMFLSNYSVGGLTTFVKDVQHAKTVSMLAPAGPFAQLAEATAKQLDAIGIKTKVTAYPTTASDLTAPVLSSGAAKADVIIPYVLAPDCIRVYKALQQLKITTPVTTTALCTDPSVIKALGDVPKGWSFALTQNPLDIKNDPNIAQYVKKLQQYGGSDANPGGEAPTSFGLVMLDAKFLNQVGPDNITSKSIMAAARAFKGPEFLGTPDIGCGKVPEEPTACALETAVNTYLGNDTWNTYGGRGFRPLVAAK